MGDDVVRDARPTIAELEKMMNEEGSERVRITPSGEVVKLDERIHLEEKLETLHQVNESLRQQIENLRYVMRRASLILSGEEP